MRVLCLGLNHRTAPVEIRERLALTSSELVGLLRRLVQSSRSESPMLEAAVISTCNRFEIYGVTEDYDSATAHICDMLVQLHTISLEQLSAHLVSSRDEDAVRHLCAVASGIESMIVGEPQILGQVVEAYENALECGAAATVLSALFRKAIECGKRARTETGISERALSVSHAAVELGRHIFGSLENIGVLLIGAGEMAELAARNLADNGAHNISVVNRSRNRADELAREFHGKAYGWEELRTAVRNADIVICSAAAPSAIIRSDMIQNAIRLRRSRPLFLVDIAVPRNVEPDVGKFSNVYVYDIDDLETVVQRNTAQRQREIPKVETIINQSTEEFEEWLHSLDVVSTIRDFRNMAEQIRDDEVARALRRLPPLSEREEEIVRILGHNIVNKLLHSPTVRLKQLAGEGNGYPYADALRELFRLNNADHEDSDG